MRSYKNLVRNFRKKGLGDYTKNDTNIFENVTNKGKLNTAIKNCEYMAKAYGNGRGFGDYLFIKGFSYFDQEKNSDGAMNGKYIVMCTHQEFDQYLQEMKTYYTCTKADDNQQ